MTSSGTAAPAPEVIAPDPTKHVKYSLGMILGAEDLDQDFAWHAGRSRWMARDVLGYGTVNGLQVTVRKGIEPQVEVSCGSAILPRGDLVRVTPAQCAPINKWLQHHREEVLTGSPQAAVSLYVVLCYDTCETDARPIPGEPCRDEAETMAASRIADAFRLELRLEAPLHEEERAIREFVRWASDTVEIGESSNEAPIPVFLDLLRAECASGSPLLPDFHPASPPDRFMINRYDACAYLKAALRVWITELRPMWHQEFGGCHGCKGQTTPTPDAADTCLLLARLDLTLDADGIVDGAMPIDVVEDDRPMLAHLRLVQEWALCGPGGVGAAGPKGPPGDPGLNGLPGADGNPATIRGLFVEMPPVRGARYAIVAAGILSGAGTMGTVFNGLKVVGAGPVGGLGPGELKLTYKSYNSPARARFSFQTIVKVLPVADDRKLVVVPAFVRFDDDGFVVQLSQGSGAPLEQAALDNTAVVVEVSEYGKLVSLP